MMHALGRAGAGVGLVLVLAAGGCGGAEEAEPAASPSPAAEEGNGVTDPVERSRETREQLEEQQRQKGTSPGY